jgi:hypothetical protein
MDASLKTKTTCFGMTPDIDAFSIRAISVTRYLSAEP